MDTEVGVSNIQEQAVSDHGRVIEARVEGDPAKPRSSSPWPLTIGLAYERFLELPVAVVLGVMWLAGVALIGSCALVLYLVARALI